MYTVEKHRYGRPLEAEGDYEDRDEAQRQADSLNAMLTDFERSHGHAYVVVETTADPID